MVVDRPLYFFIREIIPVILILPCEANLALPQPAFLCVYYDTEIVTRKVQDMQRRLTLLIIISILLYLLLVPFIPFPAIILFKAAPLVLLILLTCQTMPESQGRRLLLIALFVSMLGDAALTLNTRFALFLGIVIFTCVHSSLIRLFWLSAQSQNWRVAAFIPVEVFILSSFYYIEPCLAELKIPVIIYGAAINLMVFSALRLRVGQISCGAILFLCSDIIFAFNQFVIPFSMAINVLVMALYFSAQVLLVRGVGRLCGAVKDQPLPSSSALLPHVNGSASP